MHFWTKRQKTEFAPCRLAWSGNEQLLRIEAFFRFLSLSLVFSFDQSRLGWVLDLAQLRFAFEAAANDHRKTRSFCQSLLQNLQVVLDVVLKKIQIFNFFEKAQKRSKLSENDIYIYLRLSPKYSCKIFSQKKVVGVQS